MGYSITFQYTHTIIGSEKLILLGTSDISHFHVLEAFKIFLASHSEMFGYLQSIIVTLPC